MWNMTSRVRVSKNELQPALDLHRFTQVMCSGFHGTEIPKSPAPWPRNVAWMTAPEVSVLPWRTTSLWKRIGDMLTSVQGIFRIERNCGNIVLRSLVLYRNSGAIWHQKSWSYQDDQVPTDIQCWLSKSILQIVVDVSGFAGNCGNASGLRWTFCQFWVAAPSPFGEELKPKALCTSRHWNHWRNDKTSWAGWSAMKCQQHLKTWRFTREQVLSVSTVRLLQIPCPGPARGLPNAQWIEGCSDAGVPESFPSHPEPVFATPLLQKGVPCCVRPMPGDWGIARSRGVPCPESFPWHPRPFGATPHLRWSFPCASRLSLHWSECAKSLDAKDPNSFLLCWGSCGTSQQLHCTCLRRAGELPESYWSPEWDRLQDRTPFQRHLWLACTSPRPETRCPWLPGQQQVFVRNSKSLWLLDPTISHNTPRHGAAAVQLHSNCPFEKRYLPRNRHKWQPGDSHGHILTQKMPAPFAPRATPPDTNPDYRARRLGATGQASLSSHWRGYARRPVIVHVHGGPRLAGNETVCKNWKWMDILQWHGSPILHMNLLTSCFQVRIMMWWRMCSFCFRYSSVFITYSRCNL